MTREEHLAWCKQYALKCLDHDRETVASAIASMLSNLNKHEETKLLPSDILTQLGLSVAARNDYTEARRFIEGFN